MVRRSKDPLLAGRRRPARRLSTRGEGPEDDADLVATRPDKPKSERQHPTQLSGAPEPNEAADYILEMSLTLRNIANDSGLEFLAYLLDMAAEEADGLSSEKTAAASPKSKRQRA